MTSPDNKALIEEAMRRVAELEQAGLSFLGSFERLATALEASEAEKERARELLKEAAVSGIRATLGDKEFGDLIDELERGNKELQALLQQTQARLGSVWSFHRKR